MLPTSLGVLLVLLSTHLSLGQDEVVLSGPNVCTEQELSVKIVNSSSLSILRVKKYRMCLKLQWPPKCPVWVDEPHTKWKTETIERVVNIHRCCHGYEEVDSLCFPVCSEPCINGHCAEPETCVCKPGFSGLACDEVGCPSGNWGQDCANSCPCKNDGVCDPRDGHCRCLPGYEGLQCQDKCGAGRFGRNCQKTCKCEVGTTCHHVTGECVKCPDLTFGENCAQNCACSANGTALCYHENGNCFCNTNFYGRSCEMFCPFGYLNGQCLTELQDGHCNCDSDLYRCDDELGCVCKDGFNCEGGTQIINFASLSNQDEGSSPSQAAIIISCIFIMAFIVTILVIVYYRRRVNRLKDDLQNRSVKYIENSVHSPLQDLNQKHTLVITNTDPYPSEAGEANNLPNNVGAAALASGRPQKNVNIARSKLSDEELGAANKAGKLGNDSTKGAKNAEDVDDYPIHLEPADINLYQSFSPTKEKNNAMLADLNRKATKTNVNVILNNVNETPKGATGKYEPISDEDDGDDDPKTMAKRDEL